MNKNTGHFHVTENQKIQDPDFYIYMYLQIRIFEGHL